jgi:DNA-directed RNA polymerase subunit H (RpoH/RPB5)
MASTSNSSSLISSIFKSRQIILEIMESQGFNVKDNTDFNVNEINAMHNSKQLDMILEKVTENEPDKIKHKIYIHYYLAKTLRPQNIQEMIDDLFNTEEVLTKDDTLYIIIKDEPNETIIKLLKQIWEKDKIFIIVQCIKRLQFNILKHVSVPPHRKLTPTETIVIRQRYNIMDDSQVPELSRFDPVSLAIGIRPGEMCEIIRPSKTSITSLYYRICV